MNTEGTTAPFGRSLGLQGTPQVEAPRFRLKRWHFITADAPSHFLGVGLVHLGYLAQVFIYLVDKTTQQRLRYERVSGLGMGMHMMSTPDAGTTSWQRGHEHVSLDATNQGWRLLLDVPLRRRFRTARMRGDLFIPHGRGLSLHFDLGSGRRAYTYKVADVAAGGTLELDGGTLRLEGARATMDWTRSYALRHTRWRWASACGVAENGQRVGLNLSQHVYDLDGVSQENTLWFDGAPRSLGRVELSPPENAARHAWLVRGRDVALRFVPDSARTDARHLGLLRSHFVQASGHFSGNLCGLRIPHMYGLMENHDALW